MLDLSHKDKIRINDLSLTALLGGGASWPSNKPKPQPVLVSLAITVDISKVAKTDALSDSIDYSTICRRVTELVSAGSYSSLEDLLDSIFYPIFHHHSDVSELFVKVLQLKSRIHTQAIGIERSQVRGTIIGVNACERVEKQNVSINFSVDRPRASPGTLDFRALIRRVYDNVANTSYQTLEAFASFVALDILQFTNHSSDVVGVRASKPSALVFARSAEVEIIRCQSDYPNVFRNTVTPMLTSNKTNPLPPLCVDSLMHTAAIALGSNLGDRFANIEHALRLLESPQMLYPNLFKAKVDVIDTSFMYETAPMYVTDQSLFINCACLIETNLSPLTLLEFLKNIEATVGRVPSFRNGPRAIDLDILIYDSDIIDTRLPEARETLDNLEGELLIPHPRLAEREFVLRPLNDLMPDFVHPVHNQNVQMMLNNLLTSRQSGDFWPMKKVIPFLQHSLKMSTDQSTSSPSPPPTATYWSFPLTPSQSILSYRTRIMATLNATPDSFSDGSINNSVQAALSYSETSVSAGVDIIDIGGYSTRPGSEYVSPEVETSRVVPIIEAIRNDASERKISDVLISVDTFRHDVVNAAVLAGANCLNDVYAFTGPEYPLTEASWEHLSKMRQIVRDLAIPVVLMHSRGDAGQNKDYSGYADGVIEGIQVELGKKLDAIVKGPGGVRRWLVIVDPGIGFSKSVEDNLHILRHASSLTTPSLAGRPRNHLTGYPQLIGVSRKSFLGAILTQADSEGTYKGRETGPKERVWATASAVACAVQQGAAVVRVHDVLEMADVVRVASALWH